MIGIFDSGLGGLSILKSIRQTIPDESYIYLGDNARAPYGSRTKPEIIKFTRQGIKYLFNQGCQLVIIACNTISAVALKTIQQNLIKHKYPDHRVLGILVPTIEGITGADWQHTKPITTPINQLNFTVGILATPQTTKSKSYTREIHKRNQSIRVIEQSCPHLAPLIEAGRTDSFNAEIIQCLTNLENRIGDTYHAILLGCTHYSLIIDIIKQNLPAHIKVYDQASLVAQSLADYLHRHPEFKNPSGKSCVYLTTGHPDLVSRQAKTLMKHNYTFNHVDIE